MMDYRGVGQPSSVSLVDVLDKVLDKGLVVVGDIRVSLASVELLTIKVRLMLCSIDKAAEVGLDWWKQDPFFSSSPADTELRKRVEALERQLGSEEKNTTPRPAGNGQRRRKPSTTDENRGVSNG
jgi:hypothetical protein